MINWKPCMLSLLKRDACWNTGSKLLRSLALMQTVVIWIVFTYWLCDVDRCWGLHAVAENKSVVNIWHPVAWRVWWQILHDIATLCGLITCHYCPLWHKKNLFLLACPPPTLPYIGCVTQLLQWVSCQEKNATVMLLICAAVGSGTPALPCLEYSQHVIQSLPTQHSWQYDVKMHWPGSWCAEIFVVL